MRALLLLCCIGCTPISFPEKPQQQAALEIVRTRFSEQFAPPPIEWREDVCPGKPGKAAVVYDGACYGGLYLRDDHALVAWRGSFHESGFAHELMHAWQWAQGIDDPDHLRTPDWNLVSLADEELAQLDGTE